jgi:hypothetical protein
MKSVPQSPEPGRRRAARFHQLPRRPPGGHGGCRTRQRSVGNPRVREPPERGFRHDRHQGLYFLRILLGSNWRQAEKTRQKVQVAMAGLEVAGTGRTRWSETSRWRPDGRLEVLAHCVSTSLGLGDQIRLHLEYTWPGKCVPLMRRDEVDGFVCLFSRRLDQLDHRITLPVGTRVGYDAVGLVEGEFDLSLYSAKRKRPVVELIAHDVDADHRVGVRLDLKQRPRSPQAREHRTDRCAVALRPDPGCR